MRYLGFLLLTLGCVAAQADDSIRITYSSGVTYPPYSTEDSQISISRKSYESAKPLELDIDKYFDSIRNVLESANALPIWEPVPALHTDIVTVEIALGTRKYVLRTGYGENGPEISLEASESDQRHLRALLEILRITTERMRNHLLGEQNDA